MTVLPVVLSTCLPQGRVSVDPVRHDYTVCDSVASSAVCNHVWCPLCCAVAYLSTSGRRVSVDPVRHDYTVEDALCLIITSALGEECSFLICKV